MMAKRSLFFQGFSFQSLGVGGRGDDFEPFFRRLFSSRMSSPETLTKLGMSHVKGMIMVGTPGCGKTLLARKFSELLKSSQTTIIAGPEAHNKWAGESESFVRDLLGAAEEEWEQKG